MNREDLISWLRCNQNLSDQKVYEFCGIMGCHGMKCSACREEAVKDAADVIETMLAEREAAVNALHEVADCTSCKFYDGDYPECDNCGPFLGGWQWRGPTPPDREDD